MAECFQKLRSSDIEIEPKFLISDMPRQSWRRFVWSLGESPDLRMSESSISTSFFSSRALPTAPLLGPVRCQIRLENSHNILKVTQACPLNALFMQPICDNFLQAHQLYLNNACTNISTRRQDRRNAL